MAAVADRVQAFVEQPVLASGTFACDLVQLAGAAPIGFLARRSALPNRVLLAVTNCTVHALEPGAAGRARRLVASWTIDDVLAGRDGPNLTLTVPGACVMHLAPLGGPARDVVDLLCRSYSADARSA
jgi:hypothetical protein